MSLHDQTIEKAIRDVVYDVLGIDTPASNFLADRLREVLLRIGQVRALTGGMSNATLYREITAGRFPRPVRIAPNAVAWRLTDIEAWMGKLRVTGSATDDNSPRSSFTFTPRPRSLLREVTTDQTTGIEMTPPLEPVDPKVKKNQIQAPKSQRRDQVRLRAA